MFSDYNQIVTSEPVARYSFDKLETQHAKALELASADIVALIASGEAGERECQKEVA
jgi:ethanolamine ammonia-lyase large subunit